MLLEMLLNQYRGEVGEVIINLMYVWHTLNVSAIFFFEK